MSTERERFEAWAGSITPAGSPKPVRNSEIAWYAWQARAALSQPEPVAWIQPDHLQKARVAPFLCRVEPTKRMSDFIPIYTQQVTHGLQMECPASATDDSGSADGVGARCVDAAVMEHAARPLKAEPAPEPLTDAQVYEIWERAAQMDLSGRVNELIRTKDAQCVIRAVLKAQKEKQT